MSFVKNIFNKMGGGAASLDSPEEPDDEEDLSETSTEESDDTGVFSPDSFSPANSNSDMETRLGGITLEGTTALDNTSGFDSAAVVDAINLENVDADCSTISNFFGYWYVLCYNLIYY